MPLNTCGLAYLLASLLLLIPSIAPWASLPSPLFPGNSTSSSSPPPTYFSLLLLWPCLTCLVMFLAYWVDDPYSGDAQWVGVLGKSQLDGSLAWYKAAVMAPVLGVLWVAWMVKHSTCRRREHPFDEIVPGMYLGRYPVNTLWRAYEGEPYPVKFSRVVDLTSEFPIPRHIIKGRQYYSVPCLDVMTPSVVALKEIGAILAQHDVDNLLSTSSKMFRRLDSTDDHDGMGVRLKGPVLVFCANGRGRSAILLMTVLVMRGDCDSIDAALELVRQRRPQVHPKPHQLDVAREAIRQWKEEQSQRVKTMPNPNKNDRFFKSHETASSDLDYLVRPGDGGEHGNGSVDDLLKSSPRHKLDEVIRNKSSSPRHVRIAVEPNDGPKDSDTVNLA